MHAISRSRPSLKPSLLLFFVAVSLQFSTGICGDQSSSKNVAKSDGHTSGSPGAKIVIILLVIAAVGLLSFFLLKYWQKKKREEQHARLLKLFEEDNELEVELGLQD